jgi:hypothetical protein
MNQFLQKYSYVALLALPMFMMPVLVQADVIATALYGIVISFFGHFVGLIGLLLDYALVEFVIGFGDSFDTTGGVGAQVDTLWVNVRDIFNMTFIFGLVYIGFKMILNSDDSNTRRFLVSLIMAALLVNFSLFFTKVIIDVSNILATEIAVSGFNSDPDGDPSISTTFMDVTGITSALGVKDLEGKVQGAGVYGYIFGSLILFIVAIFVFAAGAFMLIIRYVSLIIYMILSPFMFIGWVFPQLQKYTDQYWSGFLGKAFFAPIYILLVYLSLSIMNAFYSASTVKNGGSQLADTLGGSGSGTIDTFAGSLPPFILAAVMMVASVVIASKLGADGAGAAMSIGNKASRWAKQKVQNGTRKTAGAVYGGAKYAVANTAGRTLRAGANNLGGRLNSQLSKMQNSGNKTVRNLSSLTGVDRVVRAGSATMTNSKFGMDHTRKEDSDYKANINSRVAANDTLRAGLAADAIQTYDKTTNIHDPKTNTVVPRSSLTDPVELKAAEDAETQRENDMAAAQKVRNNLTQNELKEMYANDKAMFDATVGHLKAGTFDKLVESDDFTSTQKGDMFSQRQAAIRKVIEEGGEILTENIQNMSIHQIETMGNDFITDNAELFSQSQMESISKSITFTDGQKGSHIGARKKSQIKKAQDPAGQRGLFNHNASGATKTFTKKRKPGEIANLPFDAFMDKSGNPDAYAISQISGSVLEEIFSKKTMSVTERKQLRTAIVTKGTPEAKGYLASDQGKKNWY